MKANAAKSRLPGTEVGLRAEHALVAACARTRLGAEQRKRIAALLEGPIDWSAALSAAREQRVVALCYPSLLELGEAVPQEILDAFRTQALGTAAWNLRMAAKLLEILDRAKQAGLPVIPYKGPVLAETVYGNLALREFDDLDLVVRQRDLKTVWELLGDLGYCPVNPALAEPGAPIPGEYPFQELVENFLVEVHTEDTLRHFPRRIPEERLLARLETVKLAGREAQTFSAADTLVFLAVHHAKDFWCRLQWVADIAELVQRDNFDWDAARAAADELDCRRMVRIALLLAHGLLDAAIPEPVRADAAGDRTARAAARRACERLFEPRPMERGEQILYRARMVEGWPRGMRYAVRLATMPAADDWRALRLPPSLRFAYAILRPLRLLHRS